MPESLSYIDLPYWIMLLASLIAWLVLLSGMHRRFLHVLQLEDYEPARMIRITIKRPSLFSFFSHDFIPVILSILLYIVVFIFGSRENTTAPGTTIAMLSLHGGVIGAYLYYCFAGAWKIGRTLGSAKKKLVMTSRARRIFITSVITAVVLTSVIIYGLLFVASPGSVPSLTLLILYLSIRLSPVWLGLGVTITKPYEQILQNRFMNDAKRILAEFKPLVIGITGSYGKTGTKEMLSAMLAEKYNVFRPPGSYNTLMGVTRVIREQLRPHHEMFVVEMGAYREGSITKMCKLVNPTHGLITIIGVQHLERFGSQDVIQRAKGELVRALPSCGVSVLNGDDSRSRKIAEDAPADVVYFSVNGADSTIPTVWAKDIEIGIEGSSFKLVFPDNEFVEVNLPLLGRSAVINAVAAAAMADYLKVPRPKIAKALANIPQVKHRLELLKGKGGITVIDDAFNSNPTGAENALEVLSKASTGKRILVTPGMVELGEMEEEANYNFGKQAAKACDLAVLVGENRIQPIRKGLLDGGFDVDNIIVANSLTAGLEELERYLKPGDVMLLENDLPDQYDSL